MTHRTTADGVRAGVIFCGMLLFVQTWIIPIGQGSKVQDLSDAQHSVDGEHNSQYDHEAFLGKDQAQEFEHLNTTERLSRLGDIVDKIDKNSDGVINDQELTAWIKYIHRRSVIDGAKTRWEHHEKSKDGHLSWEAYKHKTYGNMADDDTPGEDGGLSYKAHKEREYKKFKQADRNSDESLSFDEFVSFYHPEDDLHMRDFVIRETIEDMDADGDGNIGLQEYIAKLKKRYDVQNVEPDRLQYDIEGFKVNRDINNDGALNYEEVEKWMYPENLDHAVMESLHLIEEADTNKDGVLSKEEIIENQDIFVGGQATSYGQALVQAHDEF